MNFARDLPSRRESSAAAALGILTLSKSSSDLKRRACTTICLNRYIRLEYPVRKFRGQSFLRVSSYRLSLWALCCSSNVAIVAGRSGGKAGTKGIARRVSLTFRAAVPPTAAVAAPVAARARACCTPPRGCICVGGALGGWNIPSSRFLGWAAATALVAIAAASAAVRASILLPISPTLRFTSTVRAAAKLNAPIAEREFAHRVIAIEG
jgi:hypothetical protein